MKIAFEPAMKSLEAIQEAGFPEDTTALEQQLRVAQSNAIGSNDQRRLAPFLSAWQKEEDSRLAQVLDRLSKAFKEADTLATQDRSMAANRLSSLEEDLVNASKMKRASAGLKATLHQLTMAVQTLQVGLGAREKQLAVIKKAPSLSDYLSALYTYARAFPQDRLTKALGPVLSNERAFIALTAEPSAQDSNNPFWYMPTQALMGLEKRKAQQWDRVKSAVEVLEGDNRFVDMWECRVRRPNDPRGVQWYFEGQPKHDYVNSIKSYTGFAFVLSPAYTTPQFESRHVVDAFVADLRQMRHCGFVRGLISAVRFAQPQTADKVLLTEMEKLYQEEDIAALLKLRLMDFLTDQFLVLVGEGNAQGWMDMGQRLKRIDPKLHWLCTEHPNVKRAGISARAMLDQFFGSRGLISQYKAQWRIRKRSLQRDVKWVGYAALDNTEVLHWTTQHRPVEIWTIRGPDKPRIVIAQEQIKGAWKRFPDFGEFLPAEPVFAPCDGRTTREVLKTLDMETLLDQVPNVVWPSSWPVNGRRL